MKLGTVVLLGVVLKISEAYYYVQNFAGTGGSGYSGDGGNATRAHLNKPVAVWVDSQDQVYISDLKNNVVRVVDENGIIKTFAGNNQTGTTNGDNILATDEILHSPVGLTGDKDGNLLISEMGSYRIRKVDLKTNIITTFAGNGTWGSNGPDNIPAIQSTFEHPSVMTTDPQGNVYIVSNAVIRKVDGETGIITRWAGFYGRPGWNSGKPAADSWIDSPQGIWSDSTGAIYIAEMSYQTIRKFDALTTIASVIVGKMKADGYSGDGGDASLALLCQPYGIWGNKEKYFIMDELNYVIRQVDVASNIITTVAGNRTTWSTATTGNATDIDIGRNYAIHGDSKGNVYYVDTENSRVFMMYEVKL